MILIIQLIRLALFSYPWSFLKFTLNYLLKYGWLDVLMLITIKTYFHDIIEVYQEYFIDYTRKAYDRFFERIERPIIITESYDISPSVSLEKELRRHKKIVREFSI